jgi:hypothetical protein
MKAIIFSSLLILSTIATPDALAGYKCVSTDPKLVASVYTYQEANPLNFTHTVYVEKDNTGKTAAFYGTIETLGGVFMSKALIHITDARGTPEGLLTLVKMPQSCGRGACHPSKDGVIYGKLELGHTETNLSCDENNW